MTSFCEKCENLEYQYDILQSKSTWKKWCIKEGITPCECETAQEKKERLRLRRNQLARERRARVKALPEIYNILSDEGLTPVDTKPSLLTHFCKDIVIIKTAKIFFYIKKETDSDDESEDETPWCYANNKNAICNCSQPCSRP